MHLENEYFPKHNLLFLSWLNSIYIYSGGNIAKVYILQVWGSSDKTVAWFDEGNNVRLADTAAAEECLLLLESVPDLIETALIPFDFNRNDREQTVAACEFALEGLYAENKISRNEEGGYAAVTKAKKDRRGMIYDDLTESSRYS